MGIFDFLTKEVPAESKPKSNIGRPVNARETNRGAVQVFHPKSFDDLQTVIETLKRNRPCIVYLDNMKHEDGQRVIDMLSGAVFALDGGVMPIEKNIYLFTLDGVAVGK